MTYITNDTTPNLTDISISEEGIIIKADGPVTIGGSNQVLYVADPAKDKQRKEFEKVITDRWKDTINPAVELSQFDKNMALAYNEYLSLPLATLGDLTSSEIYRNRWYIRTGMGIVAPDPHRHYSLTEFAFHIGATRHDGDGLCARFLPKVVTPVKSTE